MTNKYEKKLATPSGFRDLLPDEARKREYIIEKVREVYSRFGFEPLETPVAEFEEIIVGEKAGDFNLFYLDSNKERQSDGEKESIALRFDLTVPLARVVSQYGNALPRPFKRYQVGYSFRGERPQKGRFRQFVQFDADVVGAKSIVADTEMISMITEVMKAIGVSQFVVRVNTRTLLNSLPQYIGFAENLLREVLVILDKSEKISKDEFVLELSRLRISEQAIKKLEEFSGIAGERGGVIESLKAFFGDYQDAMPGILELETIHEGLSSLGIQTEVVFDMKIIRGLGYYTGPVFETNLLEAREYGSVMSGGRYDNLTERFMNQSLPAVGVSVGVDRLQSALEELGTLSGIDDLIVRVAVLSSSEQYDNYALTVAQSLRKGGSIVDVYSGSKRDFKDLFLYAEEKKCLYAAIIGSDEFGNQTITLKNLKTREQKVYPFADLKTIDL